MLLDGYKEISIEQAGIMSLVDQKSWGAHFKFDSDVREIFPYINAIQSGARYHDNPEYIIFVFEGIQCTLYPKEVLATAFSGREAADAFAQKLVDFLNDLHRRRDSIVPNYRKYRPVSVIEIYRLLPGTNCRDCGYKTCMAFAAALVQGQVIMNQCPGFADPIYEYAVYPIYDSNGNLLNTVTIEKNPESLKEMPERTLEAVETESYSDKSGGEKKIPDLGRPPLTDREKEVLRLLAGGSTNNNISEMLHISPHTVKSHVIHIFNKLGVNDRTQAAVLAAKHHLI